jgi:hypothetical protein
MFSMDPDALPARGTDDASAHDLLPFHVEQNGRSLPAAVVARRRGSAQACMMPKESVEYARKGAGTIKARAKSGTTYNSTKQTESVTIPAENRDEPLIMRAARRISEILGQA